MANVQGAGAAPIANRSPTEQTPPATQKLLDLATQIANSTVIGGHLGEAELKLLEQHLTGLPAAQRDALCKAGAAGTKEFLQTAAEKDARPAVRQSAKEWLQSLKAGLHLPSLNLKGWR